MEGLGSINFGKLYFYMGQSSNFGLWPVTIRPLSIKIHNHSPAGTRTWDLRAIDLSPQTARPDWVPCLTSYSEILKNNYESIFWRFMSVFGGLKTGIIPL